MTRLVSLERNEDAEQSIIRLAKNLGSDILALPIYYFDGPMFPPAYTNVDGIFIHKNVYTKDAANVEVYLAHEIFHHVVKNVEAYANFSRATINEAEDYFINLLLYFLFGYNVHNVRYQGIVDAKYIGKNIRFICEDIAEEDRKQACGCFGVAHPLILRKADEIRRRFGINQGKLPLFYKDETDRREYYEFLRASKERRSIMLDKIRLNSDVLVEGLWTMLYFDRAKAREVETPYFSTTQALAYCFPVDKVKELVESNVEKIFFYIAKYYEAINNDAYWLIAVREHLYERIRNAKSRIETYKRLLADPRTPAKKRLKAKRNLPKIRRSIPKLETRLANLRTVPIEVLLAKLPVKAYHSKGGSPLSLSRPTSLYEDDLPAYIPNLTSNVIRRLATLNYARLAKIFKTYDAMKDLLNAVNVENAKEEGEKQKEQEGNGSGEEADDAQGAPAEPSSSDDEADIAPQENERPPVDELPDSRDEADRPARPTKSKNQPGQGRGLGKGNNSALENLSIIEHNGVVLDKIMYFAGEFADMLKSTRKLRGDDGEEAQYEYDNEIERVVTSEYALLSQEETHMLFLMKYAEHSLLSHQRLTHSRTPLVFLIDGSGSMAGKRYQIAAGFTLAMIKKLEKEGRSCAIVNFTGGVDSYCVADRGRSLDFGRALKVILSPTFGGTDFVPALRKAFDIKNEYGWTEITIIMITDGQAPIEEFDRQFILESKGERNKLITILVSADKEVPQPPPDLVLISDQLHVTKMHDMKIDLVAVGNTLL